LRAGEVDFFIHDAPTSWRIAQESEFSDLLSLYHPLTEERIAWAVAKDNAVLLEKVNEVIEKLHAAGTIRQVQSKWIPVRIVVN
jgi:polar amino acid transport system substrate-binding protein